MFCKCVVLSWPNGVVGLAAGGGLGVLQELRGGDASPRGGLGAPGPPQQGHEAVVLGGGPRGARQCLHAQVIRAALEGVLAPKELPL